MRIKLYDDAPVLDTAGDEFDDADLLQELIQHSQVFNRPPTFADPFREGLAGFLRSLTPNDNIEAERLAPLVGDNQARLNDPIGRRMTQEEWDAHMMEDADRARNNDFLGLRSLADYIQPTHHADPETWYGNAAYNAAQAVPGILGTVAEYSALGPAGTWLFNTILGSNNAQQQVYSNLREQGVSPDEARSEAQGFLGNAADFVARGGTNLATLYALNSPYTGGSYLAHVLKNVGTASTISGAGAAGEQALTNYRSGIDNDLAELGKTGLAAGAMTGATALALAGLDWWRNRNTITDNTPPDEPQRLGEGNTPHKTPPQSPLDGMDITSEPPGTVARPLPQGTLQLPDYGTSNASRLARYNSVIAANGLTPISNTFQPNASARQIAGLIYGGLMSREDASAMLQEAGLTPDAAQGFIDTGLAEINEPQNSYNFAEPQTFEFTPDWIDPFRSTPKINDMPNRSGLLRSPVKIDTDTLKAPKVTVMGDDLSTQPTVLEVKNGDLPIPDTNAIPLDSTVSPEGNHNADPKPARPDGFNLIGAAAFTPNADEGRDAIPPLDDFLAHVKGQNEPYDENDYYSDNGGNNSVPLQDIPDDHTPDVAPPRISALGVTPPTSSNISGLEDILSHPDSTTVIPQGQIQPQPDNNKPIGSGSIADDLKNLASGNPETPTPNVTRDNAFPDNITLKNGSFSVPELGTFSVKATGNSFHISGGNPDKLGSRKKEMNLIYDTKSRDFMYFPEYYDEALKAVKQAFLNNSKNFYDLGATPAQPETAKPAKPDKPRLSPISDYSSDEAKATAERNLQMLRDATNDKERIRLLGTLDRGQLLTLKQTMKHHGLGDIGGVGTSITDLKRNFLRFIQKGNYPLDLPHRIIRAESYDAIKSVLENVPYRQLRNFAKAVHGDDYVKGKNKASLASHLAGEESTRIGNLKKGHGLDKDDPIVRAFREIYPDSNNSHNEPEHFISLSDILVSQLKDKQEARKGGERDEKIEEEIDKKYAEKNQTAMQANEELFSRIDSPERLNNLLHELNEAYTIRSLVDSEFPWNMPLEQIIASVVLSRFPDYQPAKEALRIPVLRGIPTPSIFSSFRPDVAKEESEQRQKAIDHNIQALDKLSDFNDIVKALRTIQKEHIAAMAKSLGMRLDKHLDEKKTRESFARKFLKRKSANTRQGKPTKKDTAPAAEPTPAEPQSNNSPIITKGTYSQWVKNWDVSVEGKQYYVHPYSLSKSTVGEEYREWIIEPKEPHSDDEKIMYDAYTDSFHNNGSHTVKAVEAIRQTITDFYREAHGPTAADKASSGKKTEAKDEPDILRVDTTSTSESDNKPDTNTGAKNTPEKVSHNSIAPHLKIANRVKARVIEAIDSKDEVKPITTDELIQWANEAFGGTKGEGKFDPRDYYDAMELGINMAIKEAGITPGNAEDTSDAVDDIHRLLRVLQVIPTQTNRTDEQVKFQQFSTPPTLAYLVNWLASIGDNVVLEPSAGTGNLAVFANNADATLILNEFSSRRADMLDSLNLNTFIIGAEGDEAYEEGVTLREDALHLADILSVKLHPDEVPTRVIMNPPFSAAGKQGTANSNSNGFKHVEQALQLLKNNGRLVAILGAGRDGKATSVRNWLNERILGKYNVRAVITVDGKAYQKFGTTFGNVIIVIDKSGATPKDSTLDYSFSGDFNNDEEIYRLFNSLTHIVNDYKDREPDNTFHFAQSEYEPDDEDEEADDDEPLMFDDDENNNSNPDEKSPVPDTANNVLHDALSDNQALNAIFDYLNYDADLTLDIHRAVMGSLEDGFRDNEQKSRLIQRSIHKALTDAGRDNNTATKLAMEIFAFVRNKSGYDDEHTSTTSANVRAESGSKHHEPAQNATTLIRENNEPEATIPATKQPKPDTGKPHVQKNPKQEHNPDDSTTSENPAEATSTQPHETPHTPTKAEQPSMQVKQTHKKKNISNEDNSIQTAYSPSYSVEGAKPHPADLVESTALHAVQFPKITEALNLPHDIIADGSISDAQLEAVSLAVQSFSHLLPNGFRRGFFIGDGTGVGKGREISAIILDTFRRGLGHGKAVWFSEKHSLIADAKRDWEGIHGNPDDIFAQKKIPTGSKIQEKGILFTAYSMYATSKNPDSSPRLKQLLDWLGEDYDGIFVLDEAHNVNNLLGQNASARAKNIRNLIHLFPKARVLYVSATGATELDNFAMLDRLGLWGYDGAPFGSMVQRSIKTGEVVTGAQAFVQKLSTGGIAAMETAARDLKAMGLFIARSLSLRAGPHGGDEDVTYRTLQYNLTDDDHAVYDEIAKAWSLVYDNMAKALEACGYDPQDPKSWGRAKSMFWGAQQRFFNQILTSMQSRPAILDMEKQLKAGHSVVIQLTNTDEAALKRAVEARDREKSSSQDENSMLDDEFSISPMQTLINFVDKAIDTRVVETYIDDKGAERTRFVTDSSGREVHSAQAEAIKQQTIDTISSIKRFPKSPIDLIREVFGDDRVAEITGRSQRPTVGGKSGGLERRTVAQRKKDIDAFNNGDKDILIFSEAGGTGASYHASNDFKNKKKRIHYLLQAGWRADKAIQGLGRTHRSNEAHKPEYVLVTTDVPGQKRFIASIARRLEQLGALSAGERKSTSGGLFDSNDNLEAPYIFSAVSNFFNNLLLSSSNGPVYPELDTEKVLHYMGFTDADNNGAIKTAKDVPQFLNRILALPLDLQKLVFNRFWQEVQSIREYYEANGINLDAPAENVKALNIRIVQSKDIFHSDLFGTDTTYLQLEITRPLVPIRWGNFVDEAQFYISSTGRICVAIPSATMEQDINTGKYFKTFTLYYPDPRKREYKVKEDTLNNNTSGQKRTFSRITNMDEARKLWEQQANELPDTYTATEHMITGAILPIWDWLSEVHPKIWRINTQDGNTFLGRLLSDKDLQKLNSQLGRMNSSIEYGSESLRSMLAKKGNIAFMRNGDKLKLSSVNGEKRIEVIPVDPFRGNALKAKGVLEEIIAGKRRFFFPVGNNSVLDDYLSINPVNNFREMQDADEILDEAADILNSSIPDSSHLHIIHPSFWGFGANPAEASQNPYVHESPYAMSNPESEKRYQASKNADSSKSLWQLLKDFGSQVWKGRHDLPELAGDDRLIPAQEWIRQLKRERQANVHETIKRLRAALIGLTPDDFDLFQRAMELRDLNETRNSDPDASMPWGLNPDIFTMRDPVREEYASIMEHVRKNTRVQEAMRKADILIEDLRNKLIQAAENLSMFDVRDRLRRKHYFRHLVLEYYNAQREGKPHPTFKNPERRGYMKHRKGSSKDISSNWILAMGEVFTRMNDDIKILDTLLKLRKHYDIIEDLKQQAFQANMTHALAEIMKDLKDVPDELRKAKAQEKLSRKLLARQSRAMSRLFSLARNGNLPTGDNNEWLELAGRMADAGQLENLSREEQLKLSSYIGWLAGLADKTKARTAARSFLAGKKNKNTTLKRILGKDYLDWKDLIPDDHTLWSPSDSRLVFSASTVPEYMLKIAMDNIDELLGVDISDLSKAIASGGDKQLWCIPEKLADALDNLGKSQPVGTFGRIMNSMMGAFKRWVTIGPQDGRAFKYNWRNFFGDLEAVLQGNPDALRYLRQAIKELTDTMLKGGEATGLLAEFEKRGGGLTSEFMTELEHPDRLKKFAHLFEHDKEHSPVKFTLSAFRAYVDIASTLTSFRESILRYASFLSYVKQIQDNGGVPPYYGMSKPKEVMALSDNIYDMAFKLANENLGAYDQLSRNMQWLRDNNFLSFASWIEVNFKRFIRSNINIWQGNSYLEYWLRKHGQSFIDKLAGNGGGGKEPPKPPKGNNGGDFADDGDNEFRKFFRKAAKKSGLGAMRLAITLALAAPLWLITSIFNWLNGENDEKLPPDVRNIPHLTLNTNPFTGEVMYLGDIGSAFDFFRTAGVGNLIAGDLRDLFNGTATFGQVLTNILDGPVSKFASNANPYAKAIIEAAFGKRMFPSALHPTPIRDKGRFVAQSFGLDWYYDWFTDKPHKPFLDLADSVVNTANPEQSAYFYILSRKKQFEENVLGRSTDAFTQTRRGEALRNAKKAADLGDRKTMRKYLREFYRAGGTDEGLKASARAADPLYGLNKIDEMRFMRWLPKDERKILRRAIRYSERLKARLGLW